MILATVAFAIKAKARQLGFTLAGITLPQRPKHLDIFQGWLDAGRHASMAYLADERAIERRSDPCLILPECRSILVLGTPYFNPHAHEQRPQPEHGSREAGRVAAYAWGDDYHLVLPQRMQALVTFLEELLGQPVPNRWYTDTGPVLERELAMRAGLGWIGKNTCLIAPGKGSYFFLSEIFLGVELLPDEPFSSDQCGACTRCMDACPTSCIRPDRTLDAGRCISFQTIENKVNIPDDLRPLSAEWIFGCDICQMVCPWNIRFAHEVGDPAFAPHPGVPTPLLAQELGLTPEQFNQKFKDSPLKRTKRRGYLRNIAIAVGNSHNLDFLPVLEQVKNDEEPLVREAADWAIRQLRLVGAHGTHSGPSD
jgi:epoxyqueuosine reductase